MSFPFTYWIAPLLACAALVFGITTRSFDGDQFNTFRVIAMYATFVFVMTSIRLVVCYLSVQKYRRQTGSLTQFVGFFIKSLPFLLLMSLAKLGLDFVWIVATYIGSAAINMVKRPSQIVMFLVGLVLFLVSYICLIIAETKLGTFTRFGVIFLALFPESNGFELFAKTQKFYMTNKKVAVDQKVLMIAFFV